MRFPPMTATMIERTGDVLVVDISHDPAQSWSKAVDPKAMKVARTWVRHGQWSLVDADYSVEGAPEGRSISRYRFERKDNE